MLTPSELRRTNQGGQKEGGEDRMSRGDEVQFYRWQTSMVHASSEGIRLHVKHINDSNQASCGRQIKQPTVGSSRLHGTWTSSFRLHSKDAALQCHCVQRETRKCLVVKDKGRNAIKREGARTKECKWLQITHRSAAHMR